MGEAQIIPRVVAAPPQGRCWDALQGLFPTPELGAWEVWGYGRCCCMAYLPCHPQLSPAAPPHRTLSYGVPTGTYT